jgi:hypothetical protein
MKALRDLVPLYVDPYHKQDIQALEKVQRKGARFVTGKYSYQDSVTSMLNDLNWQPLQIRRKNKRLFVLFIVGSDFNESFGEFWFTAL